MKIIIPMAGRGSRFAAVANDNPEFNKPKPIINIKGKPMVRWALESLPFVELINRKVSTKIKITGRDIICICLQEHENNFHISNVLKKYLSPDIKIIFIPNVTRGAVETVMKAKNYIDPNDELIISDSDHYFDGANLYKAILKKDSNTCGIIPVFIPSDKDYKWSYTLTDNDNYALSVGEKDKELADKGAYANIGGYYFSKGEIYIKESLDMINENDMYGVPGKQEFFVAPIYQRLIKKGMKIKVAIIPQVWGLGTPQDLKYFLDNYNIKR